MVFSEFFTKFAYWVWYQFLAKPCDKAARKIVSYVFLLKYHSIRSPSQQQIPFPSICKLNLESFRGSDATVVCDIDGGLLKTRSFFPYFMLVSFEGGSPIRAFLLLLSWPFICPFSHRLQLRMMIFITFCGLSKKSMDTVARAILPKFYMENLHPKAYRILSTCRSSIVATSIPTVMVGRFLATYLEVKEVLGTELHAFGGYYTGLLSEDGLLMKHRALQAHFRDKSIPDLGIGSATRKDHLFFLSLCKEAYVLTQEDMKTSMKIEYPKPLVFHDGRLAFLPTPLAAIAMFMWIPIGIFLAVLRISFGVFLPYRAAIALGRWSGIVMTVNQSDNPSSSSAKKGKLYVCNHRTLLDPVFLSISMKKPVSAVTYSVSRLSEVISPIKTVRLTRERKSDAETMLRLLKEGDLVVCPEGTTCREPYLLRFSSLFAEIADEIVPVAINTSVDMFYGTTASGLKCLDPIFFMMNPRPRYYIHLLKTLPKELSFGAGKSGHEVANYLQRQLADALGFQCTNLTRKDKYLMLASFFDPTLLLLPIAPCLSISQTKEIDAFTFFWLFEGFFS